MIKLEGIEELVMLTVAIETQKSVVIREDIIRMSLDVTFEAHDYMNGYTDSETKDNLDENRTLASLLNKETVISALDCLVACGFVTMSSESIVSTDVQICDGWLYLSRNDVSMTLND